MTCLNPTKSRTDSLSKSALGWNPNVAFFLVAASIALNVNRRTHYTHGIVAHRTLEITSNHTVAKPEENFTAFLLL